MSISLNDHAVELIKREGGSATTHQIAATFYLLGGRLSVLPGQHFDDAVKAALSSESRLVNNGDAWGLAPE